MGKQGDVLKSNGMVSKSTANDLDNLNSNKKQSLVSKKIALHVSEKSSRVLFYFATVVDIIQIIITFKRSKRIFHLVRCPKNQENERNKI